ncbi:MAG: poly-gamma-glutamate system protein [Candidatus Cloacimonetes bacterium]|nr:poly-gamma-glutamate system protein [Candidatus Cloacimonadota bacterium]
MFRPSLKSNWSLVLLAILAIILFYFAQTSHKEIRVRWYDEKLQSAELMNDFMKQLKTEVITRDLEIDSTNDPNQTGLIGPSISSITTSRGLLSEKLTSLNPNMAAATVDYLKKLNLNKGDYVAIGLTGSNPGLNLALYAALETLEIKPVIITMVGSGGFGANRPEFTWLDMEKILYDNEIISFKSMYASIGGGRDVGRGLSPTGRELILEAIERTGNILLDEKLMEENLKKRMRFYNESLPVDSQYKAFINIGGGIANIGNFVNAKLIPNGINYNLSEKKFDSRGVLMYFADKNIPILHLFSVSYLARNFDLPTDPEPVPEPGTGKTFISKVNNVTVASICLLILSIAVLVVIIFDRKDRHFTSNIIDPDQNI